MIRMIVYLFSVTCILLVANSDGAGTPPSPIEAVVSNRGGARFQPIPDIHWQKIQSGKQDLSENSIEFFPETQFQAFEGMGGSFMRAGACLLSGMKPDVQKNILEALFHPTKGAGFTVGKVPIAATDFGVPHWYDYAPEEQSDDLPDFSIDHDLDPQCGIVPYVHRAAEVVGRPLRLEATMDYPPQWMLNATTPMPGADINTSTYDALAMYYLKYAQAMEKNGVPIEYISLFNEVIDSYTNSSDAHTRDLLVDHVGPLFRDTPGAPKVTWTAKFGRRKTAQAAPSFLDRDGVMDYTDIIFYHGYDCNDGPATGMGWQCARTHLNNKDDGDLLSAAETTGSANSATSNATGAAVGAIGKSSTSINFNLNTTCPYLLDSARLAKNFTDHYARKPDGTKLQVWMTEVCYASEFEDYPSSVSTSTPPAVAPSAAARSADVVDSIPTEEHIIAETTTTTTAASAASSGAGACPALPRYDFEDSMQWGKMLYADFNVGQVNAWIYWNMILDTNGGPWLISPPHNDPVKNPQQPLIIVDPNTQTFALTGAYYAMAHFSRYLPARGAAVRVDMRVIGGDSSSSSDSSSDSSSGSSSTVSWYPTLYASAFIVTETQQMVVVLMNDDAAKHDISLVLNGYQAQITMDPVSFATLRFQM